MIASALFADAAAAIVLAGANRADRNAPKVVTAKSYLYHGTTDVMGWQIVDGGFKLILAPSLPVIVERQIGADVDGFLAIEGLSRSDVDHWIVHPGGPKILEGIQRSLALSPVELKLSWDSLATIGNVSSASVLFVLADLLDSGMSTRGDVAVLLAVGPGIGSEVVLLKW